MSEESRAGRAMGYLSHVWYCAALATEVSAQPLRRVVCQQPVVLYRTGTGDVAALEDRCGHRQAPLSRGRVAGDEIQCMYHGSIFGKDGRCIRVPNQDAAPKSASIRSYAAVERWGYVWLWRGDPAGADRDAIPALPWTANAGRRSIYFRFYVKANFQLMADNLLDDAHMDFVHRASIGSRSGMNADAPEVDVTFETSGDRVNCVRRSAGACLGKMATKWAGTSRPVIHTNTQMWEAPNTIHSVHEFKNE
jgi:phenylpropionate dioxygenase-like ring-hydroxylating dioxygenase large terminal subunit